MLAAYGDTAGLVNARLTELEKTIDGLDTAIAGTTTTMVSVDTAATSVDHAGRRRRRGAGLRGAHHAREPRPARSPRSRQAATQDLPAMITDVRSALATVNQTIDQVSGDVTTFTGDLAPLIGQGRRPRSTPPRRPSATPAPPSTGSSRRSPPPSRR